jgi:hypothetical protein
MITKDNTEFSVGDNEVPFFRITSGVYDGVAVRLGAIRFPNEDEPVLQFEYNIIEGLVDDLEAFTQDLGDFIVYLLEERLKAGELLYKNGVDDKT